MNCGVERANENKTEEVGLIREFFSRPNLHPLIITCVLHFVQNWSGVNVIVFKTVHVFETVGSSIDKYVSTVIVGGVQLVSTGSKNGIFSFSNNLLLPISIHKPGGQSWQTTPADDIWTGDDHLNGFPGIVSLF